MFGVVSISTVNDYCARHWRELGMTQNYFDEYGIFVSLMISSPIILISLGILIHAVSNASSLLIKVKRKELEMKRKQKTNQATQENNSKPESLDEVASVPVSAKQRKVKSRKEE